MLTVCAGIERGSFSLSAQFAASTPGVVALFGRSGSGKTTLVNVIAGLVHPATGRVALDEAVLLDTQAGIDLPPERRRIGYVFQDARLFPHLRVAGNLRYARRRATGAAFVTFDAVVALLDLESLLDRRTHQLSGGERQRVAIGRALLTQPRLLLLDEPLAGLDRARREEVLPYLESLRDQFSIPMVYVTHDFDEVWRLATHVVLLESGRAVAQGSVETMSLDPQLRALIGPEEVGAVVEGTVLGVDDATRLTRVLVGQGELHVPTPGLAAGTALRVQLLARDLIVSTRVPEHLSVRNNLRGVVVDLQADADSDLITIDVGAALVLARVTRAATQDLCLRTGLPVWALVKSVALRGRSVTSPAFPDA